MKTLQRFATTTMALCALALAGHAGAPARELDGSARARLRALEAPHLAPMRGGAPASRAELGLEARARLRQAEQQSAALAELRAGATDNDLLLVIAIGVVIIALVVLL